VQRDVSERGGSLDCFAALAKTGLAAVDVEKRRDTMMNQE